MFVSDVCACHSSVRGQYPSELRANNFREPEALLLPPSHSTRIPRVDWFPDAATGENECEKSRPGIVLPWRRRILLYTAPASLTRVAGCGTMVGVLAKEILSTINYLHGFGYNPAPRGKRALHPCSSHPQGSFLFFNGILASASVCLGLSLVVQRFRWFVLLLDG